MKKEGKEMDFNERLKMYLEGEFIDENDVNNINKVIKMFGDDYKIKLSEENAGMFIAHLCAAYSRTHNNEKIDDLTYDMLDEIKMSPLYEKALEISMKINDIYPLDKIEKNYLILHLNNLLTEYYKN